VALKGMTAAISLATPAGPAPVPVAPAALIERHLLATWRYLRMHGASAHEADDLAQEAFVIALQKGAAELDPPATATFLRRTARFLFLRHRRDTWPAIELADAVDALWERDCSSDDGAGLLDALRGCVGELQGRARDAIERCYGLADEGPAARDEAARALGMEPNGLKTLLQRTRQVLRACIERRLR
jgi:DNA-directed RNA polymerase specialized sigma24 family protein